MTINYLYLLNYSYSYNFKNIVIYGNFCCMIVYKDQSIIIYEINHIYS